MDKFYISGTVRKQLKWHKAGQKGAKKHIPKAKSKSTTIAIGKSPFVSRNIQVETSEYLDLLTLNS